METVRLNIEYDLLLQKTKLSLNTIEREKKTWKSSSQVLGCHVCNFHDTEIIPISTNESFRID